MTVETAGTVSKCLSCDGRVWAEV